ncbi:MAG: TolC family protein, partial [Calditrichaeota bacterium]|nr:TolC family protein [Calditrichota bacterium]
RYVVVDEPPHDFPLESVETLVTQSRENSLSLQALRREIESLQVLARAARWEALPDLDLFGAIGGNGLSGEAQEVESLDGTVYRTDQVGDLGEALSQVGSRDYPSWRVGVELSLPIGGRSGGGERDRLRAQVMEAEARYLSAARLLEEQVRAAHRELYNGRRRLALARNGVEAAQEQVRIGQIEYRNGRSTAFELVRLGADFAVAQQRYSRAVVLNARAAATLTELTSGGYPAVSK